MLGKATFSFRVILISLVLISSLTVDIGKAFATSAFDIYRTRVGHVFARGLVLENDLPIWAQYDDSGNFTGAEYPYSSYPNSYALSSDAINGTHEALEQLKTEYGDRLQIMSATQYNESI